MSLRIHHRNDPMITDPFDIFRIKGLSLEMVHRCINISIADDNCDILILDWFHPHLTVT